jgi:hypothetical protein
MNGPLRNQQGCWTCRLRKKKCVEGRPECLLCESLSVTCYGYGPKPNCKDDEKRERAVTNSLEEIVKHTWRRKAQSSKAIIRIASKSSDESEEQFPLDLRSSHQQGASLLSDNRFPDLANLMPGTMPVIPTKESVLLMLFLDNVFPIQYPIYTIESVEGRGWLLPLIFKHKAFYHAALALGTHHWRITLPEVCRAVRGAALVEQKKHLEACIKLISQPT